MNKDKDGSVLRLKANRSTAGTRDNTLERASRGSTLTRHERERMNTPTFEERRRADFQNRMVQRTEESPERKTGEFHDIRRTAKKTPTLATSDDARRVPTPEQLNQSQKELKKYDRSKKHS